ncbi:E3 ubiquitin-protein ligase NEURL3 isoform X2 [Gorilla gorilla gorilla]|uniref:E3 ubiquitin-protein ligase NEURL3 isoform X2 n=1 Tax=Gorilla gorilla gorilla TaxID=9595 RepID=UPI00300AA0D7
MGAQLCFEANAKAPREALRFHAEAKGAQVRLDTRGCIAHRRTTFHDGIVFSQRPVRLGERVSLRVLREESGWCGGLRVGFTRLDPACVSVPSLPPFVCPDLEEQSPTWAAVLPEGCALTGDVVRFWVDRRGRLFAKVNAGCRLLLREGVPVGAPLWAVMDVYGTTKAIELLAASASHLKHLICWVWSGALNLCLSRLLGDVDAHLGWECGSAKGLHSGSGWRAKKRGLKEGGSGGGISSPKDSRILSWVKLGKGWPGQGLKIWGWGLSIATQERKETGHFAAGPGAGMGAPGLAVLDLSFSASDPTASRLPTAMPWDLSNKAVPEPKGEYPPKNQGLHGNPAPGSGGRSPTSYWLSFKSLTGFGPKDLALPTGNLKATWHLCLREHLPTL